MSEEAATAALSQMLVESEAELEANRAGEREARGKIQAAIDALSAKLDALTDELKALKTAAQAMPLTVVRGGKSAKQTVDVTVTARDGNNDIQAVRVTT